MANIFTFLEGQGWRQIFGSLLQISAGTKDEVWGINDTNDVFQNAPDQCWTIGRSLGH